MPSSYNRQLLQEHLTSVTLSLKFHCIPSTFRLELLVIVSFLIFNLKLSSMFISRCHFSGLAFKKLSENQSKSLSIFSSRNLIAFFIFKNIDICGCAICIIYKIKMGILKKRGPGIGPCDTPDLTLPQSLKEQLTLALCTRSNKKI